MIELENQTHYDVPLELLEQIATEVTQKDLELIITDNAHIQALNLAHRNLDKPTDVLSFPLEFDLPHMPLGSIVISYNYVEDKAHEYGHSCEHELALLFIHGLLHLVGYDHEVDEGEHRAKEEQLIEAFDLPKSLIVRNSL